MTSSLPAQCLYRLSVPAWPDRRFPENSSHTTDCARYRILYSGFPAQLRAVPPDPNPRESEESEQIIRPAQLPKSPSSRTRLRIPYTRQRQEAPPPAQPSPEFPRKSEKSHSERPEAGKTTTSRASCFESEKRQPLPFRENQASETDPERRTAPLFL